MMRRDVNPVRAKRDRERAKEAKRQAKEARRLERKGRAAQGASPEPEEQPPVEDPAAGAEGEAEAPEAPPAP